MEGRITKTENHDIYTKLMMHFNGNLYDSSRSGHSVSSIGGSLNSSIKKFGSHALYFDSTSYKYLEIDTRDFDFGTGDFTIDLWWYRTSITARHNVIIEIGSANNNDSFLLRTKSDGSGLQLYVNAAYTFDTAYTFSTGQWYHIAVVRSSGFTTFYINGVQQITPVADSDDISPTSSITRIGTAVHTTTQYLEGYLDELRISKGIARWTADFTPPTSQHRGENNITGSINTELISISKHKEGIILTDREINQEEGTIAAWMRNSIPQPKHWWKLNDKYVSDTVNGSLPASAYTPSGTDANLDSPVDSYNQDDCFQPLTATGGTGPFGILAMGGKAWNLQTTAGPGKSLGNESLGGAYGSVYYAMGASPSWDGVADSQYNGIQRIWLPKSAHNDKLGGYIDFYYHRDAFYNAFYGNSSNCVIAQNGSVYKTSISPANLVVRWDGELGPASFVAGSGSDPLNGTAYNVDPEQSGIRGQCYKFAGTVSSYVDFGNNVDLESNTSFSISFWLNSNKGSWYVVASKNRIAGGNAFWAIVYDGSNDLEFILTNNYPTSSIKVECPCNIDDGSWHYYVITYDGTKAAAGFTFYEDGKQLSHNITQDTLDSASTANAGDFWIGKDNDPGSYFNGYLSDFRIYERELTQDDVNNIYQDTRTLISMDELPRPIHYFPCDKSYSYDVGINAKTIQEKGTTKHITDNHRKAVNITPSTGYLEATAETADFERTEPFSFCWWYKTSTAGWRYILTKYDGGTGILIGATTNGSPPDILVRLRNTSGQEVRLTARGIDGVLDDGTWHHIAITYNGNSDVSGVQFYVDGRLLTDRNIVTNTLASTIKNTANFKFGTFGTGSDTVDSDYSDVRIYNVELTQEQVTKIMNETPFGVSTKENSSEMVIESRPEDGLVLWNKLGNPYEVEHSVVGYNMTEVSSPSYVNAKFGQGFNSVNNTNYITGRYVALDQGCVECWIKPHFGPTNSTVYQFITSADSGVTNVRGPLLYWKSNTDKWSFVWVNTSGSAFYCDSSFAGFDSAEELVHIACVWDKEGIAGSSDTLRIYVNGSLKDNSTSSISDGNDGAILYIGKHPTISDRFGNCVFDNIKVWDYAKIDFSDRNTEGTSPHNLIPDLNDWKHIGVTWKETQKAGLLYWNKLGSDKESVNPEVGLETVLTGSATYGTSKFGYGIGFADYNNYLTVADLDISYAAGAFECWFKVRSNWNDAQSYIGLSTTNAVQPYPILGYSRYDDRWVAYFYANSKKQKIYLLVSGLGSDDPAKFSTGDIIHFAVSWDFSRAGVEKDRISLFINGVDRTSECGVDTNTTNTWDQYTMEGTRLGGAQGWGADWSMYGYMSNVKIWDYEKTDFSDRFHEAPAEVTKKLFIDGEKQQELVIDGPVYLPEKGLILGANQLLNRQGSVLMDNIVVSKREFTEKEIRRLYLSKYIK